MKLRPLSQLELTKRAVIMRVGFDISVRNDLVEDNFRIRATLPTLDYLVKQKARIILISHRGRPEGWQSDLSLAPIVQELARLLKRKLIVLEKGVVNLPEYAIPHLFFCKHNLEQENVAGLVEQLQSGDMILLENLRFYPGEQANNENFAKKLASLGEAYVNEAFSDSHRAHASMVRLPKLLPSAAGLGLIKEVSVLSRVFKHPKKPVVVMIGGAKISDKARALTNLAKTSDYILLGGRVANLMLKVRGFEIGKSVWTEDDEEEPVRALWRDHKEKILLPVDLVVSSHVNGEPECVKIGKVKPSQTILDIGPETIRLYSQILKKGKTLVWSGPLGYIENKVYSHGTFALAWLFASRTKTSVFGVAGGGQTLEVIKKLGLEKNIDHISTGGGSMLSFLAGEPLPALRVLEQ